VCVYYCRAWRQARDEKGDRERRRQYLYSRSAISRSAAHDKREGDTSVTVVTSKNIILLHPPFLTPHGEDLFFFPGSWRVMLTHGKARHHSVTGPALPFLRG
jgi:hypothetical protein